MPCTTISTWHRFNHCLNNLWGRHLVSRSRDNIPNTANILPRNIARRFVFFIIVQRPTVISHLNGTISAIGRSKQRSIHTLAGNRVTCGKQRRPGYSTFVIADGCFGSIFCEEITGHALIINQESTKLIVLPSTVSPPTRGSCRRLCSRCLRSDLLSSRRDIKPDISNVLPGHIASCFVFLVIVKRPAIVGYLGGPITSGCRPK